ncbi:MAG: ion transporter [archaeon]
MAENKHNLREQIQFYLIDCKTWPGKFVDVFIVILNLLICSIFVIETYHPASESIHSVLWKLEVITVFFFIIEYLARLYGARNRIKHIFNIYSIIDLIAILPTLLILLFPTVVFNIAFFKILRVFRVLRIFRFLRFTADPYFFFGNITMHLLKVVRLLLTILMIFFVSSGFFWGVEHTINPNIENFGDAFYFTVITLTTVGFGDVTPMSDWGQIVTILMILSGIVLIPWQASQVIREWMHISAKQKAITCKNCGLKYHDPDASHCKSCGHVIYQEYEGN